MRKLSWMIVAVMVVGGFFSVTHFAGMWGRGGGDARVYDADAGGPGQWQFAQPSEDDGAWALRALAEEAWRASFEAVKAAEEVEQALGSVVLGQPGPGEMELGASEAIEEYHAVVESPREINTEVEPVGALEWQSARVKTEMASFAAADREELIRWFEEMEDAEVAGDPVLIAQSWGAQRGEAIMQMAAMDTGEEYIAPARASETPARTYVVSPQIAWAGDGGSIAATRREETPSHSLWEQRTTERSYGLHGTIDATYVSRFIWRGYDIYANNHSAFQPSVDLDLFGTGFGVNVWMSMANGSGFEDSRWLTFTGYYRGAAFAGEGHETRFRVGYRYYNYPDTPRRGNPQIRQTGDAQEIFGEFAWPNLLPWGLVPEYEVFAYWPSVSRSTARNDGGWGHLFGMSKDIVFDTIWGQQPQQVVRLGVHLFYNDGFGPAGKAADHDWSHALFSVSTEFDLGSGLIFVPGFNYQSSWDDSVNKSDEYWTSLSLMYRF